MLEALSTASTIGGLIAFVVAFIFIPYCLAGDGDSDAGAVAIAWLIVALMAVIIGFDWPRRLPVMVYALAIPGYFVIGFLWFVAKWRSLILRKRAEAIAAVESATKGSYPGMTREQIMEEFKPQTSRYKERIATWIVLWPWSMLWYIIKWPWRLAVKIAEWARGIADRMVERLWA